MKLLIDIPEHIYEHAKETTEDSRDEFDAMRAIANGTRQESRSEIPNTCGDAISRQAVIDSIRNYFHDEYYQRTSIQDCRDCFIEDVIKCMPSVTPQPCEDAISRREALNAITMAEVRWQAVDNVNKLPPVTPQQRTGRWINAKVGKLFPSNDFKCSECGNILDFDGVNCGRGDANYCPNCGAKMEVEE